MLTVAGMLHKTGFNVLLFDLRDHGKSTIEDGRVSIGTKEYRDVMASVDWLIEIQDIDAKRFGIYGDSMGAATAAIAFGMDDRIQSLVLDNGYLDLNKVVREELGREGYPTWLAPGAIWAAFIFGGETFLEPSPQLAFINHLDRPIFAMHGTADTRVLPHHTADMEVMAQQKALPKLFSMRERTKNIPWASLTIISIITILFVNLGDLTIISAFSSSSFLLIFASINFSAYKISKEIDIASYIPLIALFLSLLSWFILIYYLLEHSKETLYWIGLSYICIFILEFIFSKRAVITLKKN
jgi:hypothetical protein